MSTAHRSLSTAPQSWLDDQSRILTEAESKALVERIYGLAQGGGPTEVSLVSWWQGELRWARNRVSLASDRRDIQLTVIRAGGLGATTNQLDPASLEAVVRAAERERRVRGPKMYTPPLPQLPRPKTAIWSDTTDGVTPEARGEVARAIMEPAEAKGMLSAGYLEVRTQSSLLESNQQALLLANDRREYDKDGNYWGRGVLGNIPYTALTQAQCSMTVRDPQGTGSGWAGLSSYNWGAIETKALGERALQKCLASRNPVALEPGRYTVILEAQAVADLLEPLVNGMPPKLSRELAENSGQGPFYLDDDPTITLWGKPLHKSKVGLKVVDERVSISHDPLDPQLGIVSDPGLQPITWIKNGILTELGRTRQYALLDLHENLPGQSSAVGYRMSGGTTSTDEMIKGTKRGLLVTRFWGVSVLEQDSVLCTGLTRDGLWLIENGQITKAVKNFRFTESPLFVLNSLEQLGVPVPVFRPATNPYIARLTPAIVPPLKARDFSFTQMIDAV